MNKDERAFEHEIQGKHENDHYIGKGVEKTRVQLKNILEKKKRRKMTTYNKA